MFWNTQKELFKIEKGAPKQLERHNDMTLGSFVENTTTGTKGTVINIISGCALEVALEVESTFLDKNNNISQENSMAPASCYKLINKDQELKYLKSYQDINSHTFDIKMGVRVKDTQRNITGTVEGYSINHVSSPLIFIRKDVSNSDFENQIIMTSLSAIEYVDEGIYKEIAANIELKRKGELNITLGDEVSIIATPTVKGVVSEITNKLGGHCNVGFKTQATESQASVIVVVSDVELKVESKKVVLDEKPVKEKSGCILMRGNDIYSRPTNL
ncbi:hypothetical protein OTK49_01525 [Vibrio coralliirubri]|uniref:hypothetical protein n=1 Tax=Vibrio coralliirubri TaxID=1516159 RepID=UPI002283A517|nr:hypothetical protein [Vibrio coralliirubri]MCY9861205.1 hypothetical protein [Vibrio coralliirubri]